MKAMILAAGLGTRMRPLTLKTPKPLLVVGGKPLIQWHVERLVAAGISHLVINHAWLGEQIEAFLQDGSAFGCQITYSAEKEPLETGGGILRALPQLTHSMDEVFLVINADVFCDLDIGQFIASELQSTDLGRLLMVDNPGWHVHGDFRLNEDNHYLYSQHGTSLTYSGISLLRARLFEGCEEGVFGLAPLLRQAIDQGRMQGIRHRGYWSDVGTPERLAAVNTYLQLGVRDE